MTGLGPGHSDRFGRRPLAGGGTPTRSWVGWRRRFPTLDLDTCPGVVLVGAHPDDETLGLGAMAASLCAPEVPVQVVAVSDGGAALPGRSASQRTCLKRMRRSELRRAARILGVSVPNS